MTRRSIAIIIGVSTAIGSTTAAGFTPEITGSPSMKNQAQIKYNQLPRENREMSDANTSTDTAKRDMVITRVFDAPVEEVWKAWSDRDYVLQWWGPTGFTCPVADMDFREGGRSLICMRAPKEFGGQDMYSTWTYSKIDQHKRLEFVHHFSDKDGTTLDPAQMGVPPGIPYEVPHVITFKSLDDNKTEITITESGYTTDQARDLSRMGMEQCLDKMAAIFAKD